MSTEYQINPRKLTANVFGLKSYFPNFGGIPNADNPDYDSDIKTIEVAESVGESVFGSAIFESLRLKKPTTGGFLEFPETPIMVVNLQNNIVNSPIQGRPGTVKEYINRGDYKISIKGVIINHDSEDIDYTRINELKQIGLHNREIEVESRLLNLFNIYNIVIRSIEFPERKYTNVQPYVIEALSDEPIELTI